MPRQRPAAPPAALRRFSLSARQRFGGRRSRRCSSVCGGGLAAGTGGPALYSSASLAGGCPGFCLPGIDWESKSLKFHHPFISYSLFFFNDTATTEIYTLSLHDALPI